MLVSFRYFLLLKAHIYPVSAYVILNNFLILNVDNMNRG